MKGKAITRAIQLVMVFSIVLSMSATSFAATSTDNAETPVQATIEATPYDFSITEAIQINVEANSNTAKDVTDLVFTNNAKTGHISETLNLVNDNSWKAKKYDVSWKDEPVNEKCYGMKADETKDMSETVAGDGYIASESVAPEASNTTTFSAKIPTQSSALSKLRIGYVVTTVDWVAEEEVPKANISIRKTQDPTTFTIVPGTSATCNPKAHITTDAPAYLYAIVRDTVNSGEVTFITYSMDSGWKELDVSKLNDLDTDGDGTLDFSLDNMKIYYREVSASADEQSFQMLANNTISYPASITNEDMNKVPTNANLSFMVGAVQKAPYNDPIVAWNAEM